MNMKELKIPLMSLDQVVNFDWDRYVSLEGEELGRTYNIVVWGFVDFIHYAVGKIKELIEKEELITDKRMIDAYDNIWVQARKMGETAKEYPLLIGSFRALKFELVSYLNALNESPNCVAKGFWMTKQELDDLIEEIKNTDYSKYTPLTEEMIKKL